VNFLKKSSTVYIQLQVQAEIVDSGQLAFTFIVSHSQTV